uniref:RING-type E3 ubiquitin transferase n=1 Tax=Rhizochromulina marina TaxID=1034831 RepID=A0A7S2W358_9STRA
MAAAEEQGPGLVPRWEVQTDGAGHWMPFDPTSSEAVEAAHELGQEEFSLTARGFAYRVNFKACEQTNTRTGTVRAIRRTLVPRPTHMWEVEADIGWVPFDMVQQEALEAALQRDQKQHEFERSGMGYEVDLAAFEQTNLGTGRVRLIRRSPLPATPAAASTSADPTGGGTASLSLPSSPQAPSWTEQPLGNGAFLLSFDAGDGSLSVVEDLHFTRITAEKDYDPTKLCSLTFEALGDDVVRLPCHTEAIPCYFKRDVITQALLTKNQCPHCGAFLPVPGPQPAGEMKAWLRPDISCDGYFDTGTWCIRYIFPSGRQNKRMLRPGEPYSGTTRSVFLPDCAEGRQALQLLKKAFSLGQLFVVGDSITTSLKNTVVWASIHQKTNLQGGANGHGWPDKGYFERLLSECAAKGIFPDEQEQPAEEATLPTTEPGAEGPKHSSGDDHVDQPLEEARAATTSSMLKKRKRAPTPAEGDVEDAAAAAAAISSPPLLLGASDVGLDLGHQDDEEGGEETGWRVV